jgi:hypothetical protein
VARTSYYSHLPDGFMQSFYSRSNFNKVGSFFESYLISCFAGNAVNGFSSFFDK